MTVANRYPLPAEPGGKVGSAHSRASPGGGATKVSVPPLGAVATWYTVTGGADTYWRAEQPARIVGGRVAKIPERVAANRLRQPKRAGPFRWHVETPEGARLYPDAALVWEWWEAALQCFRYPDHEGTAVWTRPCNLRAKHAVAMAEQGITTVAEFDDTLLSPTHLNLFMRQGGWSEDDRRKHLETTACFDRLVFSTRRLRDMYAGALKKELKYVADAFVCRNNACLDDWPEPDRGNGRLRVGWMGSPQHARDIKLAYRAFQWARLNGCETVLIGHNVRDLAGVTHPRAREASLAWASVITRHIPWISPAEYHRTALPIDIGVIPLEYNQHTLGKSDVKMIEMTLSGAVAVCQSHPVYAEHWKHNETCLMASSPDEFAHGVRELARSRSLRDRLLSAATAYVREERSDETTRKEWSDAIS